MISSTPSLNSRALSCVLMVALGFTPVASAAPSRSATDVAKGQDQKARNAYAEHRYDDALGFFSIAYRLDPRPALLFNLAQCHRHLGDLEAAASHYERYLAQDVKGNAAQRKVARELLTEVHSKLALKEQARQEEATQRARAEVLAEAPPVTPPP